MDGNLDGGVDVGPDRGMAAALERLNARLDHIDRSVSRLESAVGEVPALVAMATDVFDDANRRLDGTGTPLPDRGARALRLMGKLTDDATLTALECLVEELPRLAAVTAQLQEAPSQMAILADIFDEWSANLAEQGIDVGTSVRQSLHAALWLGQQVREAELERLGILLRSDVLEPHALEVVGKTGRALATCHEASCERQGSERVGMIGMLKALRDPDVQRSLGFLLQVARSFGASIQEPGRASGETT